MAWSIVVAAKTTRRIWFGWERKPVRLKSHGRFSNSCQRERQHDDGGEGRGSKHHNGMQDEKEVYLRLPVLLNRAYCLFVVPFFPNQQFFSLCNVERVCVRVQSLTLRFI